MSRSPKETLEEFLVEELKHRMPGATVTSGISLSSDTSVLHLSKLIGGRVFRMSHDIPTHFAYMHDTEKAALALADAIERKFAAEVGKAALKETDDTLNGPKRTFVTFREEDCKFPMIEPLEFKPINDIPENPEANSW